MKWYILHQANISISHFFVQYLYAQKYISGDFQNPENKKKRKTESSEAVSVIWYRKITWKAIKKDWEYK